MEANELMIGDWVRTNLGHIIQVESITEDEINLEWNGNESYGGINIKEVESIPLTPEILEKIGFETRPNIGYIIDDWDGTQIIYGSWDHNLRIIKNYKTCLDIETFDDIAVHELQHALRLCEIEKEIEL